MKFWNLVSDECKAQKHHPEWGNVYNEVVVRWTTHRPRGISSKDVHMAKLCDRIAAEIGEIQLSALKKENSSQLSAEMQGGTSDRGVKDDTQHKTFERNSGNTSQPPNSIPYKSEIAYPRMPSEMESAGPDILTSLLSTEEQICAACHTGKEKSKTTGTESGSGNTNIKPKDTSPHLENTEGQSVLEEIKKHRDELDLAEPGLLGGLQEDLQVAVEKEKEGKE